MSRQRTKSEAVSMLEKSAVPRYLQLASLFRQHIGTGDWEIDAQIPTVEKLASEYGVAGMTIRQALGQLEKDGLIERFRAKGTFVRKRPSRDLWCDVKTDWNGLLMARENAIISILSDRRGATLDQSEFDSGTVAPAYRHLKRRHVRDDEPFLLADVYVDERITNLIPEEHYTTTTALRLVFDLPGVTLADAYQILTIDSADMETASELEIPLSHPIAKVQRQVLDDKGTLILVANGIYRGDKVRFGMKLLS